MAPVLLSFLYSSLLLLSRSNWLCYQSELTLCCRCIALHADDTRPPALPSHAASSLAVHIRQHLTAEMKLETAVSSQAKGG